MSIKRNTFWNIAGTALPLLLGVITIPYLLGKAGVEAFGILTLLWALIGYFGLFDFGLGRALTQQVAATRASGAISLLPNLIKSGILFTAIAGLIGGIILAAVAHELSMNWLNISTGLQSDAWMALLIAAAGIPLTTITAGLRGVLEAYEDFKTVNLLRVVLGMANFGLPALSVIFISNSLIWMVVSLILARLVVVILHAWVVYKKLRGIWLPATVTRKNLDSLLSFGAWMTVSNIISPLMVIADRFVISALLGASAVAYYTVPFEALIRVTIIPGALAGALFPRLATIINNNTSESHRLYRKSLLHVIQVLLPICMVLILGSNIGLGLWLGPEFAKNSWIIVCVMAVGLFFNGVAFIPYAVIQATGNARLTALLHIFELIIYIPVLLVSINNFGLIGAAIAWSFRTAVDAMLLLLVSQKYVSKKAV